MSEEITPFRIEIPEADLDDLRRRLRQTRWPEPATVDDLVAGDPVGVPACAVRLLAGALQNWPQLKRVEVAYRGSFACVTGVLPDGEQIPLCRLRYGGSAHSFGFAIYSAAHDRYQEAAPAHRARRRHAARRPRHRLHHPPRGHRPVTGAGHTAGRLINPRRTSSATH
jgi:Epoxide hydrolase N terminus